MVRSTKILLATVSATITSLLVNVDPSIASGLTDEQERFLGYLGQSLCMKEKNGYGNAYLEKKLRLYSRMRGDTLGKWTEFATRSESIYVTEQIAKAMLPSNCNSIDFSSKYWRNASNVMDRMSSSSSYGIVLPPKQGQEEAWIRRWCSIGWRNYGDAHVDRCLRLIDEHL